MDQSDFYTILSVPVSATAKQIEQAARESRLRAQKAPKLSWKASEGQGDRRVSNGRQGRPD